MVRLSDSAAEKLYSLMDDTLPRQPAKTPDLISDFGCLLIRYRHHLQNSHGPLAPLEGF